MIKPLLIVLMLIAAVKTGFASTACHEMNMEKNVTESQNGPITDIRNPNR